MRTKSEIQKDLTLVRDAISTRIAGGISKYTIAGRSVEYISLSELKAMKKEYEAELSTALECERGTGGARRVRFVR